VGELVPVHRVQRDDDTARLPRAEQRQHELRDVLQVDREPVALPESVLGEVGGHTVAEFVDLAVVEGASEVPDGRPVRGGFDRGREHVERCPGGDLPHGTRVLVVPVHPGPVVVPAHRGRTASRSFRVPTV